MLDQVVREVSLLLAKPETAKRLLKLGETILFSKDVGWDGDFSQARVRLLAMRAVVEEDTDGFLENAIIFFWDGPGHMPRAWGEMYADFIYICRNVASESAAAQDGVLPK
jgi:hypothetical protein